MFQRSCPKNLDVIALEASFLGSGEVCEEFDKVDQYVGPANKYPLSILHARGDCHEDDMLILRPRLETYAKSTKVARVLFQPNFVTSNLHFQLIWVGYYRPTTQYIDVFCYYTCRDMNHNVIGSSLSKYRARQDHDLSWINSNSIFM